MWFEWGEFLHNTGGLIKFVYSESKSNEKKDNHKHIKFQFY